VPWFIPMSDSSTTDKSDIVESLEAKLRDKNIETSALRQIGQAMGLMLDIDQMLAKVADIVVEVTGTDLCLIYLLDENGKELVLRAKSGERADIVGKLKLKVGEGVTGWVAKERKHVMLDREAWRDKRFKPVPNLREDTYHSMLSVPLHGKNDLVGVINVRTNPPHTYTETQVNLLDSIAQMVGGAVENFLQYQRMAKSAAHFTALSTVSRTVTSDMFLEEILQFLVDVTAQSMNFKICSVMLVDEEKGELVIKATQSRSRAYLKKPNLKIGESVSGRAVLEGKPISVIDVRKTPAYRYPDIAKKEGLCSLIAVPLMVKGKVIGVLNCYTSKPHVFTSDETDFLIALGSLAAMSIENAKLMVRSAIVSEMHHRIKNSLQTIASLLRLEMRYGKVESAAQMINESINRILAIAAVHEMLSGESLDAVNIKKVIDSILNATGSSMIPVGKNIRIESEGMDLMLSSRKATSVALILNELVQNAIEHGFRSVSEGEIKVSLSQHSGDVRLTVDNTGDPLPDGFDLRQNRRLGLQIVENLVRDDLNGRFILVGDGSVTHAIVEFAA